MKRSRFTEEQVIAILKEQEPGMKTADVCRKHGISAHDNVRDSAVRLSMTTESGPCLFAQKGL
ncbi:transposase [Mesorhizobium sp. LNHC229A00]|nr:transposase [Mesorhizobium sp. LNHC229A00]